MNPTKEGCVWCEYNGKLTKLGTDPVEDSDKDYEVYLYECPECGREVAGERV